MFIGIGLLIVGGPAAVSAPPSGVPVISVAPAVTGTAREYEVLSCDTGTWTNVPSSYAYDWKRAGVSTGITTSTYTLAFADVGAAMTCAVTATNGAGASSPSTSNSTSAVVAWTPSVLGASLLADWNASTAANLSLSGSNVITWTDDVAGSAPTQGTSGSRPVVNATGLNGAPSVDFDGTDDYLEIGSVPGTFPNSTTSAEMWALVDQKVAAGDATMRTIGGYGGTSVATWRGLRRPGSTTNFVASDGSTDTSAATGTFTGIHVCRGTFGATMSAQLDGGTAGTSATMGGTVNTRVRLGARVSGAASNFGQYAVARVLVTLSLGGTDSTRMTNYLKRLGGLP